VSVSNFAQKVLTDLYEIFREGWQWDSEKLLNFGGDPDHRLGTGIIFRICHYWEIWKVVSTDCACATLQCRALSAWHRHSNYDVIMSPAHDRKRD